MKQESFFKLPKGVEFGGGEIVLWQEGDNAYVEAERPIAAEPFILTVSLDSAGGGYFVALKTGRWSLDEDEIQPFADMLKEMLKKANAGLQECAPEKK